MRVPPITQAVLSAVVSLVPRIVAAASFTVIDVPAGVPFINNATSISADGSTVVGSVEVNRFYNRAFIWDEVGGFRLIEGLPDVQFGSVAYDVSADGKKVVGNIGSGPSSEAFIWDATNGVRVIGDLPGGDMIGGAFGISDDGSTVVGRGARGINDLRAYDALVWTESDGLRGLSQLPGGRAGSSAGATSADGSRIAVALYDAHGQWEGAIWDSTEGIRLLGDLPIGAISSTAINISADGSTVVGLLTVEPDEVPFGGPYKAMIWDEAHGIRTLGSLFGGLYASAALGVSGDGSVVVGTDNYPATGGDAFRRPSRAFVWDAENGMRPLDVLLASLGIDLEGWKLLEARSVSADGRTILGRGLDPNGQPQAFVAVIPEPGTAILIGIALAVLASVRSPSDPFRGSPLKRNRFDLS